MVMTSQCPIVSIYLDIKGEHKVSMFVEFQSQMNLSIFNIFPYWQDSKWYTANVLYVVFTDVCLPTKSTNNTK